MAQRYGIAVARPDLVHYDDTSLSNIVEAMRNRVTQNTQLSVVICSSKREDRYVTVLQTVESNLALREGRTCIPDILSKALIF